ncbi:hypothetical protein C8D92_110137 [Tamilnaduibacter salinus]|uniref:Uncharacterized protein n=1 Tax=Tamilnaduibacter salinus TaxID=1484056 RepID=A0A2U1CTN9_9GAMM|nr:hypothetical protein [Tamilnaduibacter salinus]PVY70106.1 hypothetical protein C8D92_110137 [Tamilnaduibacter salinus]
MPYRMLVTLAVLALSIPIYAEEAARKWQNQMFDAAAAGNWKNRDRLEKPGQIYFRSFRAFQDGLG